MAYQVTKRIKGRDYLYNVEGYRDSKTGKRKTRWQYVGPVVNGEVQPPLRKRSEGATRENVITATARLMEHRDPSNITISVIVSRAKISPSTFYRYFRDRKCVVNAALARVHDEIVEAAPRLDVPLESLDEARQRFREWYWAGYYSCLKHRALRWALSQGDPGKLRVRIPLSLVTINCIALLAKFLKAIHDAGFAAIEDPVSLARSICATQEALCIAHFAQFNETDVAKTRFADVFPAIERAVFGLR